MEPHEFEIEIRKDGTVRAHVRGAKGRGCLDYAEFLEEVVGRIVDRELTHEYHEPDSQVRIEMQVEEQVRRRG
ncbi:DUF2997 domain-containing protein [Planctomycetota bacterium]